MVRPAMLRRVAGQQPTRIISAMPGETTDLAYPSHNNFYPPCSAYTYYLQPFSALKDRNKTRRSILG